MAKYVPFLLLFATSCWLSYIKEIDRLERDEDPRQDGKRFLLIGLASLVLSFLFTLWSADAGLILQWAGNPQGIRVQLQDVPAGTEAEPGTTITITLTDPAAQD